MPKSKKSINFNAPATKGDVEELAQITEKNFRRIENKMATKGDLKQFATQDSLKQFATKRDLQASEKRILDGVKTIMEVRDDELQGKHEIELDRIAVKTDAPPAWKSIPRRLKTVETEVEKIKDHLEIS